MLYNLKKIGWYFDNNNLNLYKGNPNLEQDIHSENNRKIFEFINTLKDQPLSKKSIRCKLKDLSDNEFKSIFDFFLNNKWIYPVKSTVNEYEIRLNNFINCIPNYTYSDYCNDKKNVKILLMGLGTAGSYIIEILTKLGFNDFILIDGDKVEKKNIMAQNYNTSDIGKLKTDIMKEKYANDNIKISTISGFIRSYNELKNILELNEVTYFINCADDFDLQMEIMKSIFIDFPKLKMIYSGYSFLIHSDDFITKDNYKTFRKVAIDQSKNLKMGNYIIRNMGSILNGFMNAWVVGDYILNDITIKKTSDQFLGDFYNNRFYFDNVTNKS